MTWDDTFKALLWCIWNFHNLYRFLWIVKSISRSMRHQTVTQIICYHLISRRKWSLKTLKYKESGVSVRSNMDTHPIFSRPITKPLWFPEKMRGKSLNLFKSVSWQSKDPTPWSTHFEFFGQASENQILIKIYDLCLYSVWRA